MHQRYLHLILTLYCLTAPVANAQTEFEQWQKKEAAQLQQFRDVRDKAFTEFLQREWQAIQASQGLVSDQKPKPIQIPVYQPPVVAPKDTPHWRWHLSRRNSHPLSRHPNRSRTSGSRHLLMRAETRTCCV